MAVRQTRRRLSVKKTVIILTVGVVAVAGATEVSGIFKPTRSIVVCLDRLKIPSRFPSRDSIAALDTHAEMREMLKDGYQGTVEENLHLVKDFCPSPKSGISTYGKRRSRESFATYKSPKISWELYNTIRSAIRDTARAHGVDEEQALQLFGCESIGFDPNATNVSYITVNGVRIRTVDRGIGQINDFFHPEVTEAQAYNWRYNIGWTIRTAKVEFVPKKGKYKGELYSQAAWWICRSSSKYLGYGIASIRAQPKSSVVASNSD